MNFIVNRAEHEEDWNFFYSLSFETLKVHRKPNYDQLVNSNPDKSDSELLAAHRKALKEYFDFESPQARVFIAVNDDGTRCGYLWMGERSNADYWDFQKPQWIYDIVVDPRFQRNGLGKILLREAEKFALEMHRDLGLNVYEENTSAINLYRKEGYLIKCIPMSKKLPEEVSEEIIDGYSIRELSEDDAFAVRTLGLTSYHNMVKYSKDIPDDQVIIKYDEYLEKINKIDGNHCTFVAESDDGEVVGFVFVGGTTFSDKVGEIYDSAVGSTHKDTGIVEALIAQAEFWTSTNNMSILYYLLHSYDDITQELLESHGYTASGFFMEKDLARKI